MGKPSSSKAKVQLPKDALKRINFGQSFAEYDKLLEKKDVFVKTPAMEAAFDHTRSKCFFVGRRGTGKTAITYYLENCLPKFAFPLHPQLLVPETIQIPIQDLKDSRQKPFKTLMSCVRRALTDEALSFWVGKSLLGYSNFSPSLTRERNFVEDLDFDGRFLRFLEEAYTPLNSGNEKDWLKQMSKSKEILSEADALAGKHGLQAILMIDRIDEAWDGTDKSVLFLMALMHACIEISSQAKFFRPLLFCAKIYLSESGK